MPVTLNPSNGDPRKFKVATIQAEPVWLNLRGGVDKTIGLIKDAARQGAKIVGFPEVFIPGYPWTPWANSFLASQDVLAKYQANSMGLHSPEMAEIRAAAKATSSWVVLGFSERDGGSLYIAQVIISAAGEIVNHRRKIKPTHYEKTIFGDGSAQSIHNVVQTPYGRLGALNCWEHIQPALKAHFYSQLPQLFVGGWWPAFPPGTGDCPYIVTGEASAKMTQMVAMEGGCFGLTACQVVSEEGAKIMKMTGFPWFKFPGGGFSVIYGPDGSELTERIDPGVEKVVVAEISLDEIDKVKLVADTMGNYSRHDLLHVVGHGKNWRAATYGDETEQAEDDARIADVKNLL